MLKCAAFPVSNFEFQSCNFVNSEFFHRNFSIPLFYVALNVGLYYQKRYQRCFVKKLFLKIPINSQEDTCVRVSFLVSCRRATLLKKKLWYMCFPANLLKFFRTPFCKEHLRWLLLYYLSQIHIIIIFWWFSYKQVHGPKQTSKMELLAKIVNDLQLLLTIFDNSISNVWWAPEYTSEGLLLKSFNKFQKQSPQETPVLESLFNKIVGFNKKMLQHRCFPVKFVKFLKVRILKNICKGLLLNFGILKFRTFLVLVAGGETFSLDYIIYIKAGSKYYLNLYETVQYLY